MLLYALAFLLGDVFLQSQPALPTTNFCLLMLMISVILTAVSFSFTRYWPVFMLFFAGFIRTAWVASSVLSHPLPHTLENKPITVTGMVASLVNQDSTGSHFLFRVDHANTAIHVPQLVRMSWHDNQRTIKPGDIWRLTIRLKRIHGLYNPGGFDAEKWALMTHLRGSGYVLSNKTAYFLEHHYTEYIFDQFRQFIQVKIVSVLPKSEMLPWLFALTTGDREKVRAADWEVLRKTGTNHLMAIAGLHIGLVAGVVKIAAGRCLRWFPALALKFPLPFVEAAAALFAGFLYAGLAGFSLPARRAFVFLIIFAAAMLLSKRINAWVTLGVTLLLLLIIDPLSVLSESFWLSFCTIAFVIYGMRGRVRENSIWWKVCRIQWVIGFALIPLTLYFYHEFSLVSFFANIVTIPLLAFLILPLSLFSAIFIICLPPVGHLLLLLTNAVLKCWWFILCWFDSIKLSTPAIFVPDLFSLLVMMIGVLILLLPIGQAGRWLGIIWCLPAFLYLPVKPAAGDLWMTLLDVGQGLSVVVMTPHHTLIFDSGPKVNEKIDAGRAVIIPYLQSLDRFQIDALIISHGDNDHIGGVPATIKKMKVHDIVTSVPEKFKHRTARYCLAGQRWWWDGVMFEFLYPTKERLHQGNNSSCVLRIVIGKNVIILPGDIEKSAESELIQRVPEKLMATVLVAPHHGSQSSGLSAFIEAVYPQYVLYATGYLNKYHLPTASVVLSYDRIHAIQLNNVDQGSITLKFNARNKVPQVMSYRNEAQRYWLDSRP